MTSNTFYFVVENLINELGRENAITALKKMYKGPPNEITDITNIKDNYMINNFIVNNPGVEALFYDPNISDEDLLYIMNRVKYIYYMHIKCRKGTGAIICKTYRYAELLRNLLKSVNGSYVYVYDKYLLSISLPLFKTSTIYPLTELIDFMDSSFLSSVTERDGDLEEALLIVEDKLFNDCYIYIYLMLYNNMDPTLLENIKFPLNLDTSAV